MTDRTEGSTISVQKPARSSSISRQRQAKTAAADRDDYDGSRIAPELDMGLLSQSVGYHMRRAQIAIFHDIISAFAEHDIRPAQFSVLVLIGTNPGLNQSVIASALGIKRTNFVALIDSLERRGLARRSETAADRRSYALFLTDTGTALMEKLQRIQQDHEDRVSARIGAEHRALLLEMLSHIAKLAGDEPIDE